MDTNTKKFGKLKVILEMLDNIETKSQTSRIALSNFILNKHSLCCDSIMNKDEWIDIYVEDVVGKVWFRMKKHHRMRILFRAYASKRRVERNCLRFTYNGEIVNEIDTPDSLSMEDGDSMDCAWEGGIPLQISVPARNH